MEPLVRPSDNSEAASAFEKPGTNAPKDQELSSTFPPRTRFHSGVFEQRDRLSSSGLPDGYGEPREGDDLGVRLMADEGTADGAPGPSSTPLFSKATVGRGRFAFFALLSLLGAIALSVTIYFIARPKKEATAQNPFVRACSVFCHGPLLGAVQSSHLFNDSKTFVDMPIIADPEEVLAAFSATFEGRDTPPTRQELSAFVSSFFLTAGSDTEPWVPTDYSPMPPQLAQISNATLRDFALGLNDLWLQLGRRIVDSVKSYPQRYSLVWQPYPLVVPGGRFLESYYWDSFWIVMGLLRSGMRETAMGVVLNLVHLLDNFGFVPNGGRIYYSLPGRSQPPLLSAMVREIFDHTGNVTFLAQVYPSLLNEYAFWMKQGDYGHAVTITTAAGKSYVLNRYVTTQLIPRPESWLEDVETAAEAGFNISDPGAQILYSEIAAGAETGWDFSSRWFGDGTSLTTSDTSRVVPVELNAFLYGMESNIAYFASVLGATAADRCGEVYRWSASNIEAASAAADGTSTSAGGTNSNVNVADGGLRGDNGGSSCSNRRLAYPGGVDSATVAACLMMQSHPVCSATVATGSTANAEDEAPSLSGWAGIKPQGRATYLEGASSSTGASPAGSDQCSSSLASSLAGDAQTFKAAMIARGEAIEALLWDEAGGKWVDLRIVGGYHEVLEHHSQLQQQQDVDSTRLALHPATAVHRSLKAVENGSKGNGNANDNGKSSSGGGSKKSGNNASAAPPKSATTLSSDAPMDATSDPNLHPAIQHYFSSSSSSSSSSYEGSRLLLHGTNVVPVTNFTTVASVSSYSPLFTAAFDMSNATRIKRIVQSLQGSFLFLAGGLTSTTANTTQQWDRPNGWAPLQHIIIKGLNATGVPEAVSLARELARTWVLSNFESYRTSGFMPEKMDAAVIGLAGGGGEYAPQVGFGWSNGVVLELICAYDFPHLEPVAEAPALTAAAEDAAAPTSRTSAASSV